MSVPSLIICIGILAHLRKDGWVHLAFWGMVVVFTIFLTWGISI